MTYKIEPMAIHNYDDLIALWSSDPGIGISPADSKENISSFLQRNHGFNYIAQDKDRIIGTILCGNDGRRGYLYHLYVVPECRKRGIGHELVSACIDKLKNDNITKCHLMFFIENDSGKSFWEKAGFSLRDDIGVMSMIL